MCDSNQDNCFNLYTMSNRLVEVSCWESIYFSWNTTSSLSLTIYPNWSQLLSHFSSDCSQDSNYLQCLEDKNQLIWQVSTLSWNLNTCQSSLSSCQNWFDVSYQACVENLSGCQSDLSNMTNYNDSLNLQLQECLANTPLPDEPCEWTGCEEILQQNRNFSLFWERDDNMFSLPVANNLFLPQWYRAYVDSWVVAISKYEDENIEIKLAEWSFDQVNTLYFTIIKAIVYIGLFALFIWFIKTIIYPLFIPKKEL